MFALSCKLNRKYRAFEIFHLMNSITLRLDIKYATKSGKIILAQKIKHTFIYMDKLVGEFVDANQPDTKSKFDHFFVYFHCFIVWFFPDNNQTIKKVLQLCANGFNNYQHDYVINGFMYQFTVRKDNEDNIIIKVSHPTQRIDDLPLKLDDYVKQQGKELGYQNLLTLDEKLGTFFRTFPQNNARQATDHQ